MKKVRKMPICFILLAAMIFTCFYGSYMDTLAASAKKKIIMNQSKIRLTPGSQFQLKVKKVTPAKTGKTVSFKSKNKKVSTVSKRGLVTAKKPGTAKIDIVSKKNKSIKTTVTVMVQAEKKDDNTSGAVNSPSTQKPEDSAVPAATPTAPAATPTPTAPAATQTPPSQEQPSELPDDTATFNNLQEVYSDIVFKEFSLMVSAGAVDWIALDLSGCKDMSDADKQSLAGVISETYGKETVLKTSEELKEEGSIVDDSMYGFVLQGGVLIRISESEKDSSGVSFEISCTTNGLTAKGFARCTASIQNGKWVYKLDGKMLA